jgi:hypothetical protein
MIYVAFSFSCISCPCVPRLFSHGYQEIGDDVTLCTFYHFFLPLLARVSSRAM